MEAGFSTLDSAWLKLERISLEEVFPVMKVGMRDAPRVTMVGLRRSLSTGNPGAHSLE